MRGSVCGICHVIPTGWQGIIPSVDCCFYCDALLVRWENDHFPIPREFGGVDTVPACVTCHDAKDRSVIDDWPADYLLGQVTAMPVETLQLANEVLRGDVDSVYEAVAKLLDDWWSIRPGPRLVLAKMVRVGVAKAHLSAQERKVIEDENEGARRFRLHELNEAIVARMDAGLVELRAKMALLERQRRLLVEARDLELA